MHRPPSLDSLHRAAIPRPTWLTGLVCGILSSFCYGLMTFAIHSAADKIPSSEITFIRSLSTLLLLFPLVSRGVGKLFQPSAAVLWLCNLTGAISILCLAWNLQHTSVGFANTLFDLAPLLTLVFGMELGVGKASSGTFIATILIAVASVVFWHGSRAETHPLVWIVGLLGMLAAAASFTLIKKIPSTVSIFDLTWSLALATIPIAFALKHGPWIAALRNETNTLIVICSLSLAATALAYASFRSLDLGTASALVPSSTLWGVTLDMTKHDFPFAQGFLGCALYLIAIFWIIRSSSPQGVLDGRPAHDL